MTEPSLPHLRGPRWHRHNQRRHRAVAGTKRRTQRPTQQFTQHSRYLSSALVLARDKQGSKVAVVTTKRPDLRTCRRAKERSPPSPPAKRPRAAGTEFSVGYPAHKTCTWPYEGQEITPKLTKQQRRSSRRSIDHRLILYRAGRLRAATHRFSRTGAIFAPVSDESSPPVHPTFAIRSTSFISCCQPEPWGANMRC